MHNLTPVVIVLLVLFSIYRRTRKTIGFQKFVKGRMLIRMILFSVVGCILIGIGYAYPMVYLFDAIGLVLGSVLAYHAARTTKFEWRKDAWFYSPNPWIGVFLVVLFVGRMAYRIYTLFNTTTQVPGQSVNQAQLATYVHDPYTAIILFMLITYYIAYYTFLIRKEGKLEKAGTESIGR